jgi:hypothetical protein
MIVVSEVLHSRESGGKSLGQRMGTLVFCLVLGTRLAGVFGLGLGMLPSRWVSCMGGREDASIRNP